MIPLVLAASFFLGSIPFGLIVGKTFYGADLRTRGSGNIGAANAVRAFGIAGGLAVLVLDALKAVAAILLARMLHLPPAWIAASAALVVTGHVYSPWLGGRGGKGVATTLGALAALSPPSAAAWAACWIACVALTRYSSVGSLCATILAVPALFWFGNTAYGWFGVFALLIVTYAHRANIERLRSGQEHRITFFANARDQG